MGKTPPVLDTIDACDHELFECRKMLHLVINPSSRYAVMDQIDRILEMRYRLSEGRTGDIVEPVVDSSSPET